MKKSYSNPLAQLFLADAPDVLTVSEAQENWSKFYYIDDTRDDIF